MKPDPDPENTTNIEEVRMDSYIDSTDDLSKLLMSFGSISKGFGGQGQRMGETAAFNINFRANADPEVKNFFLKIYGEKPEKINFFLPCNEIDKCITAPYTAFNAGGTMIAKSDGKIFTYLANLSNPLNIAEPYLRDGKRCSDGQEIPYQPDLGFLGKPNMKMQMSGQMFVFIKELLEVGVFQTMSFKFHTTTDRDMLRKRLSFIRDFAAGINVPLTAIPMFLTKYKKAKSFIDQNGVPRRSEHFYLDLVTVSEVSEFPEIEPESADCGGEDAENQKIPESTDNQEGKAGELSEVANSGNTWKEEVFALSDEQQSYVCENVTPLGSRYGIRPELLENYKDKNGTPVSDLSFDDICCQIEVADEYLGQIMNNEITVDKKTVTKAKKRRCALITAALIKQNKYTYY